MATLCSPTRALYALLYTRWQHHKARRYDQGGGLPKEAM